MECQGVKAYLVDRSDPIILFRVIGNVKDPVDILNGQNQWAGIEEYSND